MTILAAIDSFKGSASSFELNQAALNGWFSKKGEKINRPIADGGEGTTEVIYHALGGQWRGIEGVDLLFRKVSCRYLLTIYAGKRLAVIEATEVIGLDLLAELYIWDETLNYLDVFNQVQLEQLILSFKPAMLVVDHDQVFLNKIADRLISLK